MSRSTPRRAFDMRVVALTAAALAAMAVGVVAGWQIPSDEQQPENRAVPTAQPSQEEDSPSPEPETTDLTPASPDESLTEVSPTPEPTTSSPEPEPSDDPATSAPPDEPSSPEASLSVGPVEPTENPSGSTPEELRDWCEASEPYDYFGSPEFREMCEEEFGNG